MCAVFLKLLLPYEYEFTCVLCGYNIIKGKNELIKIQRKKINFNNRLKYAELKNFCICIDVYRNFEDKDFDEVFKDLSQSTNWNLKKKHILIEKYKDSLGNFDFEQKYSSRTAEGIYRIGHDSVRLFKWLAYYDRCFLKSIK